MSELHQQFVQKLQVLYGEYDSAANKFTKSSNSDIARDLSYSDAQFSRLTHGSASEGEYTRGIRGVDRLLRLRELEQQLADRKEVQEEQAQRLPYKQLLMVAGLIIAVLTISLLFPGKKMGDDVADNAFSDRDQMLQWVFGTSYINPYVKLKDLPDNCNYPSYRYQGIWHLDQPYKIPLYRERNGFHYMAREVNMYARSMSEKSGSGEFFEGYEYQLHEIWYDTRELPIDSFLEKGNSSMTRKAYQNLDFNQDENYVMLALVHTFFRNEFEIDSANIIRKGKVIGRDIELMPMENLAKSLGGAEKVKDLTNQIKKIADYKLEDFSIPIACNQTVAPLLDYHLIEQGAKMSFTCVLTTGRFPIQYTKTYVLAEQYIKNSCR